MSHQHEQFLIQLNAKVENKVSLYKAEHGSFINKTHWKEFTGNVIYTVLESSKRTAESMNYIRDLDVLKEENKMNLFFTGLDYNKQLKAYKNDCQVIADPSAYVEQNVGQ